MLLARRSPERLFYPGVWDVIGGHCEKDEAPGDALVREVKEEIGVTPRTVKEIAVLAEPRDPGVRSAADVLWQLEILILEVSAGTQDWLANAVRELERS